MIKTFFTKRENIFMAIIGVVSIFCVVLGFSFLFFKTDVDTGPKIIPNEVQDIVWKDFSSKIINKKITYPEYMFISEQRESNGVGVTIAEFEPRDFLTYFSNQNHVSIYPSGMDNQLFYGKTKKSEYTTETGQRFVQTEYLTADDQVWGIMLVPTVTPKNWQKRGFIWIQTAIKNKEILCISDSGIIIDPEPCDPFLNQNPLYKGDIYGKFIQRGYEIVNKNIF